MAPKRKINFGYSEYWRRNKSAVESKELVRVLVALRKVGRHIASNIKSIEWAASLEPGSKKIGIDINLARGEYPLPPGKMDFLVGIITREAYHSKILSDVIWLKVRRKLGEMSEGEEYLLALLIGIGEDIFTAHLAADTVWKYYLPFCWSYVRPPYKPDVTAAPTIHTLLYIFADYVFFDKLAVNMNPLYHDLFRKLLAVRDSIKESIKESSISKRCNIRAGIYLKLWKEITQTAKEWKTEEASPEELGLIKQEGSYGEDDDFQQERTMDQEDPENEDAKEKESPNSLLKTVNEILESFDDKGVNQQVQEIAGEDDQWKIIDTTYGKASLPCLIRADQALVARLKRIFAIQRLSRSRRYQYNRGLLLGRLDGRRLHRYSLDGRIFRQREYLYHDNTRNIVILVDGSASMSGGLPAGGKQWSQTERIFVSLFEAVKGTGNRLDLYAYYERAGMCEVNLLAYNNRLFTVRPGGRTPTGQAIVAVAMKMPKDKQRLIVHLTDGETNCGISVQKGLEFCDKEGIDIVTIGTYYDEKTKVLLEEQYQDRAILIDSLDLLPVQLEEVLRANLLK